MFDFLKKVPFFADLPDADLDRLCEMVTNVKLSIDEVLFTEGEIGDKAYVITSGEIDILKESGGRDVLLATRHEGEVIGEMSLLDQTPRFASGVAKTDCELLAISHENMENLLDNSPSAARVMLSTFTNRLRSTELILRQSEKMAQLGTLTAGIAHELNNPASAARRGAEHLQTAIINFQVAYQQFHSLGFSTAQWEQVSKLQDLAKLRVVEPIKLDSLEHSDREAEIEDWLDDHDIEDGWDYAPHLVSLGYQDFDLDELEEIFPEEALVVILKWVGTLFSIYSLLEEIHQGTSRIGEIVKSLKSYVYLDQAPVQLVDLHEGLDNTLVMLRSKLKTGVKVERDYDETIPNIQGYGSELNQVWTNIIDNAVDAMEESGTITIRTKLEESWVLIEIEDTGPGMPKDVQEKIFSPFFTTKPMGKGTGLGMNISFNIIQKHKGEIKVFSRPGKTCFRIHLPVNFEDMNNKNTAPPSNKKTDEELKDILTKTKNIAVVGISSRETVPAHTVPAYLQRQGYRIIPINPKYEQVLGERAYPSLTSLTEPVDVVLVFRRSDFIPDIVREAIEIGAKTIWMQLGLTNPEAADMAQDADLDVVMDTCMRLVHQRLIGKNRLTKRS